jgi:hypothetical protein
MWANSKDMSGKEEGRKIHSHNITLGDLIVYEFREDAVMLFREGAKQPAVNHRYNNSP